MSNSGYGWTLPSRLKINERGIPIEIQWYNFFEKILVWRGTSISDQRVPIYSIMQHTQSYKIAEPKADKKDTFSKFQKIV